MPPLDDRALTDRLLSRLAAIVGTERLAEARARQLAAPTGSTDREWSDIVWEIFDAICVPAVDVETRVGAVVTLYDLAPSYAVLSQGLRMHQRYEDLPRDARVWMWEQLRPYLDAEDDRIAEPPVHGLWAAIVGARWPFEERLLARILRRSGPVAPRFKYPLYERLLEEQPGRWDGDIYAVPDGHLRLVHPATRRRSRQTDTEATFAGRRKRTDRLPRVARAGTHAPPPLTYANGGQPGDHNPSASPTRATDSATVRPTSTSTVCSRNARAWARSSSVNS